MNFKLVAYLQILAFCASGQAVIKGTVLDEKNNRPLPFASVYINYTTIGTNADDKGNFSLNISPGTYDLVASFVGHSPYNKKVTLVEGEVLDLAIRLQVAPMQEIQVKAKRDAQWEKQLERFKKFFIGTGSNAKLCRIVNPWVLTFPETTKGVFYARASSVLEVENLSLGYRITYDLKNFAVISESYLVAGFVRFQELTSNDSAVTKKWTENRKTAYEGSTRHFFKSITEHCVDEEQFELYEDRSDLKQLVRLSNFNANLDKTIFKYSMDGKVLPGPREHTYTLQLPTRLEVIYRGKNTTASVYHDVHFPVSWIESKTSIIVNDEGIPLNPFKMTILGAMFESRIADLLPNNYEPERKVTTYINPIERKPLSKLSYLTEKPYLQTDKSYYYPEEMVWFKGYMNYFARALGDSLSHVLHIDMVDKDGNVVLDRRFPIVRNTIIGDFSIPPNLTAGDYTLRAYTRWMLNFDPVYSFKKAIKILKAGEAAKMKEFNPADSFNTIGILSDKNEYEPREKISLTFDIQDEYGRSIAANLSVSVTDLKYAVPASNEVTITNNFLMPTVLLPDTLDRKSRLLIQNGFDIKGKFITTKPRQPKGLLRFVQQEANTEFVMSTEEDGSFYAPNLIIYDTAALSVVAQTVKGNPGTIEFDQNEVRPRNGIAEPLQLETHMTGRPVRPYIPDFSEARILETVTIKRERIETKSASLAMADFEVSGESIRESYAADVLSALQMKVPGLRVIIRFVNGFPVKYLSLSGISSFGKMSAQEPLVLIDNVVVNDMIGGPAQQLEQLNPAEIERVEVSKFASGAAYGARGGNGVISIYTGRTRLAERSALGAYDKSLLKPVPVKGYSVIRKFISPDYSNPENNVAIPDTRTTIYWNPSVQKNDQPVVVYFFAADTPTRYRVVVEGVTKDGNAVRGEKIVTIRKQLNSGQTSGTNH